MKQRFLFDMAPYKGRPHGLYYERRRLLPEVEEALLQLRQTMEAEILKRKLSGKKQH